MLGNWREVYLGSKGGQSVQLVVTCHVSLVVSTGNCGGSWCSAAVGGCNVEVSFWVAFVACFGCCMNTTDAIAQHSTALYCWLRSFVCLFVCWLGSRAARVDKCLAKHQLCTCSTRAEGCQCWPAVAVVRLAVIALCFCAVGIVDNVAVEHTHPEVYMLVSSSDRLYSTQLQLQACW